MAKRFLMGGLVDAEGTRRGQFSTNTGVAEVVQLKDGRLMQLRVRVRSGQRATFDVRELLRWIRASTGGYQFNRAESLTYCEGGTIWLEDNDQIVFECSVERGCCTIGICQFIQQIKLVDETL